MKKIIAILLLAILLLGCNQPNTENQNQDSNTNLPSEENQGNENGGEKMVVESGDTIKVEYVGKLPETGEVFDKSEGRGPLEFTAGTGQMISGFDAAVIGMELNEEKTVTLAPEQAYGYPQRTEVPVEQIAGNDENVSVGTPIYTSNGMQGKIVEINDGIATIEIGHQLAGKTLEFWIKVVEINKN
jgi:peptidylprolyl isomerase